MSHAIPAALVGSFSNFGRPLQNCAVVPFLLFELLFSPIQGPAEGWNHLIKPSRRTRTIFSVYPWVIKWWSAKFVF